MQEREAELLPVPYFHVVFTLPAEIDDIAYTNKAVIYDLLFKASSETMLIIVADPKHLGARIGITSVLHTWGSASCRRRASGTMTHHPHVHMIVPGGALLAAAAHVQPTPKQPSPTDSNAAATEEKPAHPCPCCGGRMVIIEMFEAGQTPRHRPTAPGLMIRVDTS